MKNEFIKIEFVKDEIWTITHMLRFVKICELCEKILQQLHQSNLGNQKWVDVPTETE